MQPPRILTPLQERFLEHFFQASMAEHFFLTGGTALAAFYLYHRLSEDLDLFTLHEEAFSTANDSLSALAVSLGGVMEERVSSLTYHQAFIRVPGEPELKIDLVRDAGPQFGERQHAGKIIVDSELNIAVNKVTALFGRASSKDFVDLYFLLKQGMNLEDLIVLAKQKDPGFSDFYFANMLRHVEDITALPRMIVPLNAQELRAFFAPIAEQMMLRLKPRE